MPKSSTPNPLEMSDEDFLNMNGPVTEQEDPKENDDDDDADDEDDSVGKDDSAEAAEADGDPESEADPADDDGDSDDTEEDQSDNGDGDSGNVDPESSAEETSDTDNASEEEDGEDEEEDTPGDPEESQEDLSYKAFHDKIMAPFKANGKLIQLKSVDEAIQLMQMGANYTKKLQDIQPHRKVLLMLQNHELLDEGKLSYLIDLYRREPEAIKKLVKDSGIDPMDIDVESEPNYRAGNHRVTDEQAVFVDAIEGLSSTNEGKQTLQTIDKTWDDASKEALWKSPEIMSVIHQQRSSGVYDQIVTEMDRQITLGNIQPGTPFLERYKAVGDAMHQQGAFGQTPSEETPAPKPEPRKLAERAKAPKPKVKSGEKASAASTTRNTPRKTEKLVNPLAMSDDEFLSQFKDRL